MVIKISVVIITYQEEESIGRCLRSVEKIGDEVLVVVDTKTSDKTAQLAEESGARVFHQEYLGDGPQKAFAVPQASNDWILSIDADERLDHDAVSIYGNSITSF